MAVHLQAQGRRRASLDGAARSIFEQYDSDGDGYMGQFDFLLFLWDLKSNVSETLTSDQAQFCWMAVNVRGTGQLSEEDFCKGLHTLWERDFFRGGWPTGYRVGQDSEISDYDLTEPDEMDDIIELNSELRGVRARLAAARRAADRPPLLSPLSPLATVSGDMRVVRVYRENESYKSLIVTPQTRCRELLRMVLEKLDLPPDEANRMVLQEQVNGALRALDNDLVVDVEERQGKIYVVDQNMPAKITSRRSMVGAVNLFRKRSSVAKIT